MLFDMNEMWIPTPVNSSRSDPDLVHGDRHDATVRSP